MNKIVNFLQNRWFQHSLFWSLSFYIFLRIIVQQEAVYSIDLIYAGLFHISLILAVYTNLYLLIPKWLQQKRYAIYLLCILALIGISALLNRWFVDQLGGLLFEGYYFISEFSLWEIAQFTTTYLGISSLLQWSKAWFTVQEKERRINQLEKEKLDIELQALKAQINPHFLFNSLNNLYSLALDQDQKTPELILGLSKCLRYMLYECSGERVPLEKELNYIADYIELQKMRLANAAEVNFEINGIIKEQQIAPLLLIPILENAFKHGLKGDIANAYLDLNITIEEQQLALFAKNNKGQIDDSLKTHKGLGLHNLKQQLSLVYPEKHQISIDETANDFALCLKLDLS